MPKTEAIRGEVHRLQQMRPFRPFALILDKGQRLIVEHPENIAYDPKAKEGKKGWDEFYLFSGDLRVFSTFEAISSVALADSGEIDN